MSPATQNLKTLPLGKNMESTIHIENIYLQAR